MFSREDGLQQAHGDGLAAEPYEDGAAHVRVLDDAGQGLELKADVRPGAAAAVGVLDDDDVGQAASHLADDAGGADYGGEHQAVIADPYPPVRPAPALEGEVAAHFLPPRLWVWTCCPGAIAAVASPISSP